MEQTVRTIQKLTLAVCAIGGLQTAQAQGFPSQTIRVIVPAIAGAPSDTLPRTLIEPLGRALGQAIVVENRVGGDGCRSTR